MICKNVKVLHIIYISLKNTTIITYILLMMGASYLGSR